MERDRKPEWIALGLVSLSLLRLALVFDQLPERVASHFDLAGYPDGYQSRLGFVIGAGLLQLMFGMLVWVSPAIIQSTRDELLNLPHKAYWLAPERRVAAKQRLGQWTSWLCCATVGLLSGIFELTVRANLRHEPLGPQLWILLGAYIVFMGAGCIALLRAFRPPDAA